MENRVPRICPTCERAFVNLKQHITKSHTDVKYEVRIPEREQIEHAEAIEVFDIEEGRTYYLEADGGLRYDLYGADAGTRYLFYDYQEDKFGCEIIVPNDLPIRVNLSKTYRYVNGGDIRWNPILGKLVRGVTATPQQTHLYPQEPQQDE